MSDFPTSSQDILPPVSDGTLPEFEEYMGEDMTPSDLWFSRVMNPAQRSFLGEAIVPVDRSPAKTFSLDIPFGDDNDYRISPPYGVLGLASNATSENELRDLKDYCVSRSQSFLLSGDTDQARMFGYRAQILQGLIDGTTTIRGRL